MKFVLASLIMTASLAFAGEASDYKVFDQTGQERSFFKDVVADKKAAVVFSYSSCKGVCPLTAQKFKKLQEALGDRLGKDVVLLTMSIDPEHETAATLKAWADSLKAAPGWTFLSGKRSDLDEISQRIFGGPLIGKDMHSPFLVVRKANGQWERMYGLALSREILERMDSKER